MGDLHFKRGNYLRSMEWYLKHVKITNVMNTEYLMENFVFKLDKEEVMRILHQLGRETNL